VRGSRKLCQTPGAAPDVGDRVPLRLEAHRQGVVGVHTSTSACEQAELLMADEVFRVAAVDLDRTLRSEGCLSPEAIRAIDQGRRAGLVVVLVTSRTGQDLQVEFPEIADHVDALVLENGAVAVIGGKADVLSPPVDDALDDALTRRGVPFRRGEALVAVDAEHAGTVLELITRLGLDCQLVRDERALLVLPAGVTKGFGLCEVLKKMHRPGRNITAVGDAENDLTMVGVTEIGAAVANAIPSVPAHADLVLVHETGADVADLLVGRYLGGARLWCPPRRWVDIGSYDDGTPTQVPGSRARVVVTGPAGSGKSYLVGLLAERWIESGYCVLVIDALGDHLALQELDRVQVVEVGRDLLDPAELPHWLGRPDISVVVEMSRLAEPRKFDYVLRLRAAAQAHREEHGFPDWLVYDGRQLFGGDTDAPGIRPGGWSLSSFDPATLPAGQVDDTEVLLELTEADSSAQLASWIGPRASIRLGCGEVRPFTVAARQTTYARCQHI